MKIQKVNEANQSKAYAFLQRVLGGAKYQTDAPQKLHENGKLIHDWVCLHTNKVIAYIAFSNAYQGDEVCGLHLAPLAVAPEFQKQGIGSELLNFALRQDVIKNQPLFVFGEPGFFQKFGFEPCRTPLCPFGKNNAHFSSLRNPISSDFVIGYEAEFKTAAKPVKANKASQSTKPTRKKTKQRR